MTNLTRATMAELRTELAKRIVKDWKPTPEELNELRNNEEGQQELVAELALEAELATLLGELATLLGELGGNIGASGIEDDNYGMCGTARAIKAELTRATKLLDAVEELA